MGGWFPFFFFFFLESKRASSSEESYLLVRFLSDLHQGLQVGWKYMVGKNRELNNAFGKLMKTPFNSSYTMVPLCVMTRNSLIELLD